ncbi:MAG: hypothetical protein WKF75_02160 [Singulisphaera sp.]
MMSITAAVALTLAAVPTPMHRRNRRRSRTDGDHPEGRDIAGYDAAAWHASDAVMVSPKPGSVAGYIARKTARAGSRLRPARREEAKY